MSLHENIDNINNNLTLDRIINILHLSLKNLRFENEKLKSLTDGSIGIFQNIRNTLFSFLGLGFSLIFGLPFIFGEDSNIIDPIWLIGSLTLIGILGLIIYVATNIYSGKLERSLSEIDRVYFDGVMILTLVELFINQRMVKSKKNLLTSEIQDLYTYIELLVGGIYCTIDDRYKESARKIPIDKLKKKLYSSSPIDSIFVDELCTSHIKTIESRSIPKLKQILQLHTNFSDIVKEIFMLSLYKRCKG
jgi:hypothetical protein